MGKLFLIEGVDGCGKETQARLLAERLGAQKLSFPRYGTPAARMLEDYLHGEIALSPYSAAAAFAADREAWAREWRENGCPTLVLDRYIFSNWSYQGAKFETRSEAESFIEWSKDYEYNRLGLPVPDVTVYLVWTKTAWLKMLRGRGTSKHSGKDIHEQDVPYLEHVYGFGMSLAIKEGAVIVPCDGLSREEIHEKIYHIVAEA